MQSETQQNVKCQKASAVLRKVAAATRYKLNNFHDINYCCHFLGVVQTKSYFLSVAYPNLNPPNLIFIVSFFCQPIGASVLHFITLLQITNGAC